MPTEAELEQAILDTQARRVAWNGTMDTIQADANAYSIRRRGRPLPQPNRFGQLPASGVAIMEMIEPRESKA